MYASPRLIDMYDSAHDLVVLPVPMCPTPVSSSIASALTQQQTHLFSHSSPQYSASPHFAHTFVAARSHTRRTHTPRGFAMSSSTRHICHAALSKVLPSAGIPRASRRMLPVKSNSLGPRGLSDFGSTNAAMSSACPARVRGNWFRRSSGDALAMVSTQKSIRVSCTV